MTISSSILALSPTTYWKLDESAGPTAFDSSGHGHNGQYQPGSIFSLPGPENGTFCMGASSNTGGVVRNGLPVFGNVAHSYVFFVALNPGQSSAGHFGCYGGSISPARGFGNLIDQSNVGTAWDFLGLAVFPTGQTATVGTWHLVYMSWDTPAGGTSAAQCDVGAFATLTGHTPAPSLTGDQLVVMPPGGGGIAHFAEFNYVLNTTQVSSIFNGVVGAQAWPGSGATLTQLDLIPIINLLNLIYAAVHKVFPTT